MTTGGTRRSQTERRKGSEEKLIRGAIEIIARHGANALTFEAIGRESRLSRGMVTQRFGSKQRLVEAILLYLHDNQQARLRAAKIDLLPGLDAITAYIAMSFDQMALTSDARAYFLLLSSSLNDALGMQPSFRAKHAEVERQLACWITRGQAERNIRHDVDPGSTALFMGCLMFGAAMQLLTDPDMKVTLLRETAISTLRHSLVPS